MEKYLMLDIDGILCTDFKLRMDYNMELSHFLLKSSLNSPIYDYYAFNPICVGYLNRIVKETNCKIVISSSWRRHFSLEGLKSIFEQNDFLYPENIIGVTPRGYDFVVKESHCPIPRGLEIKIWLDLNVRKTSTGFNNDNFTYCILDDDPDMLLEQKNFYVQTNFNEGITKELCVQTIKILNNGK